MGRKLPQDYHNNYHNNPAHRPLLSYVFLVFSIATTVTIVTVLCGFLSRKKEKRRRQCNATTTEVEKENTEDRETNLNSPRAPGEASPKAPEEDLHRLPMPPAAKRAASYHFRSSSHASMTHKKATLTSSMSMRVGGDAGKEKKREKKLKHEDSIWKKTIILGEKCKVPDEEDDDDIVYDEKGNKVTPYHPKTSIALQPLSRQSSHIDNQGDDEDHVNSRCKMDQMIVIDNNQ
ncbi:hypothetical protein DM860_007633 [Cuscuta australis]|uniref:Transmembrane protein n=1 Tax=Cuscuta australis TaxID=267555 RepID=A0A328E4I8_9ASTE|nr:hypothetical protein DM860_007633 [Cuscuta australis]